VFVRGRRPTVKEPDIMEVGKMKGSLFLVSAAACLLLSANLAVASQVSGDYVESRNGDVYTGPCFANGQVGLAGNEATIAWKIREGEWNGVPLAGLAVVAVARASSTLGDPYHDPLPAKAVLLVDARANEVQKGALIDFARYQGGRLLDDIVEVRSTPITMEVGEGQNHGYVSLKAGDIASIRTRPINSGDHFCGNETTYYPPLTELSHSMPAYALDHEYSGKALGSEWRIWGKRSAFVGTFGASQVLTEQASSHHH
jgi:hypothetical protein